jgi:hypothetical protein
MLTISPHDAIQLPADELAMPVLAGDLASWHEANEYNYGNSLRQETNRGYDGSADARKAVYEAMRWPGFCIAILLTESVTPKACNDK